MFQGMEYVYERYIKNEVFPRQPQNLFISPAIFESAM